MINALVNELYVPEWLSIDIRLPVTPRRIVADNLSPEFRTQNLGKRGLMIVGFVQKTWKDSFIPSMLFFFVG